MRTWIGIGCSFALGGLLGVPHDAGLRDNAVTISSIGAVLILLVYGAWLVNYLRAGAGDEPAIAGHEEPPLAFRAGTAGLALVATYAVLATVVWFE